MLLIVLLLVWALGLVAVLGVCRAAASGDRTEVDALGDELPAPAAV